MGDVDDAQVVSAGAATLGFGIPLVYLLRKRAGTTLLHETVNAPPRRAVASTIPSIRRVAPASASAVPSSSTIPIAKPVETSVSSTASPPPAEDDFNGALYSAKAFGIATLMVCTGAVATVVGVKAWLGVKTTEEFACRMRDIVLEKLPSLSERIHRSLEPHDHPDAPQVDPTQANSLANEAANWNWPDAEQRLRTVYDKDGIGAWGEAALQELEAEGRLEREKRFGPSTPTSKGI
ncbi:hypothetical protein ONZ45_g16542 [Pleurotus djamor]|nr:hypothetical protein ONZ45_g16542 [Pleurotus djamor]